MHMKGGAPWSVSSLRGRRRRNREWFGEVSFEMLLKISRVRDHGTVETDGLD